MLSGGELFDRIVSKTFYNEKEARDLVRTLLRTVKHLHDQNIIHRDLKVRVRARVLVHAASRLELCRACFSSLRSIEFRKQRVGGVARGETTL